MLPTFELQFFTEQEYSVDLTVPISNIILLSTGGDMTVFNMDMFFNANAGDDSVRAIAGPGIGFAYVSVGQRSGPELRIPA